ncbi:MAG: hypothetical protein OEZ09_11795 [Betaproteobacteria bacterium]|nr:hypothetical protein [Betaproteobacteria bacterium]
MAAITKEQAQQLAKDHAARVPLSHPDYRLGFTLSGRIGDEWLFAYRIECLKNVPPEEQDSANLWWRHCCSGDCCVASRRELAMVLDTASHRLGRVSHLLIPLALKAGEVVIAPPYDRLQRTARYGVPGAKCGSAPAEPERWAMER